MTPQEKNARMAKRIIGVILVMVALSFASVPLYRVFCQVTGYGGTMRIGGAPPDKIDKREVTILFDTRVDGGLPWQFRPEKRKLKVHIGQQGLISFKGDNLSSKTTAGTALYNVTPEKVGKYFYKTQCFCFDRQEIGPGKTAHFPVMFYVDPAFLEDLQMADVTDITLSYTMYPAESDALERAMLNFGGRRQ